MKVLFLIDSLIGYGAEKSLLEIIIRFKNINAIVVHLFEGDQLKGKLEKNGVKVYSLNLKQSQNSRKTVKILSSIIESENPPIIHTTLFKSEMAGRELKRLYPQILLIGSFVSNSYSEFRFRQLSLINQLKLLTTQWRDKYSAGKVDFFISNSEAIKSSNAKALGINEDKIVVIYRGRNISFSSNRKNAAILRGIDLKNKRVFLNVARLQQSKGQMDLLRAFKNFHRKNSKSVLLIAGEGGFREQLERYIKENSLEKVIYLLGYRDDVSSLLAMSNFFIFPSYYEGLPGALIEAILSETPSIISNIPENKECLPENTALFFDAGNIEEIQNRMEEALRIQDWNEKTKKAKDYAILYFDINNASKQYEDFYFTVRQSKFT